MTEKSDPHIVDVTAAIMVKDGKILIAKRKVTGSLPNKWEFPGGKVENGETAEQCLKRELMEEFGIVTSIGMFIGSSVYHYDHISINLLAFNTYWQSGDIIASAHDDYRWVEPSQLDQYDFAPADLPFVDKLRRNEIDI